MNRTRKSPPSPPIRAAWEPGTLFVAVPGVSVDGHDFIHKAQEAGASAVVCERLPEQLSSAVTYVVVPSSAIALGYMASEWWGNPSRSLRLVGVTGTNGKTTTATLIYEMARLLGHKAGLLSTVCNYVETTPTRPTIQPPTHSPSTRCCDGWSMPDVNTAPWRSALTPPISTA